MSSANQFANNWYLQVVPVRVYNTSAASGTYQAASADRNKLHIIAAEADVYINSGTGSSVSVTTSNGQLLPANTVLYFHPVDGAESLGWVSKSGAAVRVSMSVVSR